MTVRLFRMFGRIVLLILILFAQGAAMSAASAASLEACAGRESAAAQAECLGDALGSGPPDSRKLRALEDLVGTIPEAVLTVATERVPADGLVGAQLQDLRGQALMQLGRHGEAADAFDAALALDDGTLRLTWWSLDGEPRWTRALETGSGRLERAAESLLAAGREAEAAELISRALSLGSSAQALPTGREGAANELRAEVWHKRAPDLRVPLTSGGAESLRGERQGKALILSFWASWCEPCGRELPKLQELYDSLHGKGLDVLAVNVGETPDVIASYMAALELSLPTALSTSALEKFFKTDTLPVIAVIDGRGRVRGRWAGYKPAFAEQVSGVAREVIEEASPPATSVGEVLFGGDALRVAWMREAATTVEGLVVAPRKAAHPGVLAAARRALVHYGEDGDTIRSQVSPVSVSRLTRTPVDDEGGYQLLGYRPGASTLVFFPTARLVPTKWSVGAPLFDAALRPVDAAEDDEPAVMIATLEGVFAAAAPGATATPVPAASSGASAVRAVSAEGEGRWAMLALDGRLVWSDGRGQPTGERPAPADGWVLVGGAPHESGLGVAPPGLTASAVGRFLSGDREQIALATAGGQLILLDAMTGETVYRARWPGITGLAAGDLVGDSRDDLAVTQGKNVALLTAGSPSAPE